MNERGVGAVFRGRPKGQARSALLGRVHLLLQLVQSALAQHSNQTLKRLFPAYPCRQKYLRHKQRRCADLTGPTELSE